MLNELFNFDEESIKDISDNLTRLWENIFDPNSSATGGGTMAVLSLVFGSKSKM